MRTSTRPKRSENLKRNCAVSIGGFQECLKTRSAAVQRRAKTLKNKHKSKKYDGVYCCVDKKYRRLGGNLRLWRVINLSVVCFRQMRTRLMKQQECPVRASIPM